MLLKNSEMEGYGSYALQITLLIEINLHVPMNFNVAFCYCR